MKIQSRRLLFFTMGRPHRVAEAGDVYHVLNRANARMTIFEDAADYEAFERVLQRAIERTETRLLTYCLMPNHWRLLVWPQRDGELSRLVGWLTLTHTPRWHAHRHSTGSGHMHQGRFRSFPSPRLRGHARHRRKHGHADVAMAHHLAKGIHHLGCRPSPVRAEFPFGSFYILAFVAGLSWSE